MVAPQQGMLNDLSAFENVLFSSPAYAAYPRR